MPCLNKFAVPLGGQFHPIASTLKMVYVLDTHTQDNITITPLVGMEKLDALQNNLYRKQYLNEYDVVLIPGGVKSLEKLRQEQGVLKFIQEWNAANKTIFSICNGAQLLISAGILKGRTISGYYSIDVDIENAGATYSRGPVVVDGNIISCPHYDFMGDWMRTAYQVHNERTKK
jgi:putative intracellular protease/amidase